MSENEYEKRAFGNTGLTVSALGFGAGHIGSPDQDETYVGRLLNEILDMGVTLIDTARGYGMSEERIGRHLKHRRQDFVLSTKIGYDIPGHADWSASGITAGVEAALQRLQTDYIDIVHLHSCGVDVLERGEVIEALLAAVDAGKIRVAAYSGDNEALSWAVNAKKADGTPVFGSLETSINICDQRVIHDQLAKAVANGQGVIAKRPIANAPWRYATQPYGNYAEEYWLRWKVMGIDPQDIDWTELALRFTAYLPGVSSCIVGTSKLEHMQHNLEMVKAGKLPDALVAQIQETFRQKDNGWVGQV
jgi:aryl-alcohol dehydrogenase-like predicted oxidoreductase